MNKNISVWRGSNTPPTNYHLWIKPDNTVYLHDGVTWNTIQNLTKIDTITLLPSDKNFKDNEFLIYILENDIDITNPEKYNRNQTFTAKRGDFYLSGVMVNTNPEPQAEKDPRVIPSNGSRINIVFKNGDYELGVTSNNEVRTVRRLMEPTWEIIGLASNCYIKHIKTGKYLYYDFSSQNYILSEAVTYTFKITSKNSSIKSYEIGRSNSTNKLNMKSGSGFNYYISEYDAGDINNELFFINPSVYVFPNANTTDQEYQYNISFKANLNLYIGKSSTDSKVLVSDTPSLFYLEKLSDGYYIKNSENTLLNVVSDVFYCDTNYSKFKIAPVGYESNQTFEIVPINNEAKALNPFRGINNGNELHLWNRGDSNNLVKFVLIRSKHIINRIISTSTATNQHDGLMSASDKIKLDLFQAASNYKTKQTAKSSPSASSSTDYLFIDTITQNANGEITATKKTVRSASQSQSGLMSASDKIKLDSFQSATTYATRAQFDSINLVSWSVLDPFNGYEYVDLGLPSGTLWATADVDGYDDYFSWGIPLPTSSWLEQLQPYDFNDTASYNMGGGWVLPTKAQFEELFKYTTASEPLYNGYSNEIVFTSTINGNSIKFNLYGYGSGFSVYERGSVGKYWTSDQKDLWTAYLANMSNSTHLLLSASKYIGCKIRGVINL